MPKQQPQHGKSLAEYWRQATPTELEFYRTQLYPLQDRVFEIASLYDDAIYLTARLLWDFPRDQRDITASSLPVLQRRARQLPLPDRLALLKALPAVQG